MKDIRNILRFASNESPIPMILCTTDSNKSQFLAMIDTGSEVTILDESLKCDAEELESGQENITLRSMHGEDNVAPARFSLNAFASSNNERKIKFKIEGILSELTPISEFMKKTYGWSHDIKIIIGSDTLNRENAIIDCELGRLMI